MYLNVKNLWSKWMFPLSFHSISWLLIGEPGSGETKEKCRLRWATLDSEHICILVAGIFRYSLIYLECIVIRPRGMSSTIKKKVYYLFSSLLMFTHKQTLLSTVTLSKWEFSIWIESKSWVGASSNRTRPSQVALHTRAKQVCAMCNALLVMSCSFWIWVRAFFMHKRRMCCVGSAQILSFTLRWKHNFEWSKTAEIS